MNQQTKKQPTKTKQTPPKKKSQPTEEIITCKYWSAAAPARGERLRFSQAAKLVCAK